jgi:PIN domain nuclease of toxin-antitoxin system
VNLLIDTHTFLWFVNDDPRLSETAVALLESDNTIFLSITSIWEIAIKVSINKLTLPQPFGTFVREQIPLNDIALLPLRVSDCEQMLTLPFHHLPKVSRL